MANDIYVIDLLAPPGPTITVNDDGLGIDEIRVSGVYSQTITITLQWSYSVSGPLSAAGTYWLNPPDNLSGRLIVNGVIENARGSNGADYIAGNQLANTIFGDASRTGPGGNDTLFGDEGDDIIYGGAGSDSVAGAEGNDTLYGDDGVNSINGDQGIDIIEGGAGADILSGGADDGDTVAYSESNAAVNVKITYGASTIGLGGHAQGDSIGGFTDVKGSNFNDIITDTVKGTIAFGYNDNTFNGGGGNDILFLGGGNDVGVGGIGNDLLTGEEGNDLLDGGAGVDNMRGGAGNDVYVVDNTSDIVNESLTGSNGIDTVQSSIGFSLANTAHVFGAVERLTLTGSSSINGTGNTLNNVITGNNANNTLSGGNGNDTLRGGLGVDKLFGGLGNDVYVLENGTDTVSDAGGIETATSTISRSLAVGGLTAVERLTLTGSASINGTGNSLNNVITGNTGANILNGVSGNDTLSGGIGNDTLIGGNGNDKLTGGTGNDSFVFNAAISAVSNVDTITDFNVANDTIRLDNAVMSALGNAMEAGEFWKSTSGTAHDSSDRIIYETDTGWLNYDSNGSKAGGAVHIAKLAPNLALTAADFVVI